jgi:hypothetical protein
MEVTPSDILCQFTYIENKIQLCEPIISIPADNILFSRSEFRLPFPWESFFVCIKSKTKCSSTENMP